VKGVAYNVEFNGLVKMELAPENLASATGQTN